MKKKNTRKKRSKQWLKTHPYCEIIEVDEELNEYIKLCGNKSKKFKYYSDWENYIIEKFSKIPDEKSLMNFKHYFINKKRNIKHFVGYSFELMLFAMTIYIDRFIPKEKLEAELVNCLNEDIAQGVMIIIYLVILFFIAFVIGTQLKKEGAENDFYTDLITIIEKIEESCKKKGV